jgi:hypothetical protein
MTDRNKASLFLLRTMESRNKEIIRSLRPSGEYGQDFEREA